MKSHQVLALDAMGVLYAGGDDVAELLIPFIRQNGGTADARHVEEKYIEASLGNITAAQFWKDVGIDPGLEDRYLSMHELMPGVDAILRLAVSMSCSICCISNDVREWSGKLRRRFSLADRITDWFVSGDIGSRKPDERIYRFALNSLGVPAERVLFVDDRVRNLDAATRLGMDTVWLSPKDMPSQYHRRIGSLELLADLLASHSMLK
jgi:HAD superfamily hydrolase (TIGR01509 family)